MADYVQRMVEGLARTLARIAVGRRAGRLDQAQSEIADAAQRIAGVDISLVDVLGPTAITAHLDDRFRLDALASLCDERAEVEAARGDAAGAERWHAHALAFRGKA